MADQPRSEIIKGNPIGKGLDTFRASFSAVCADRGIPPHTPDALGRFDQQDVRNLVFDLLLVLQNLPAARLLPATTRRGALRSDLLRLELSVDADDIDLDRIKPLLNIVLADHTDDALIWGRVYDAVAESAPPPRSIASSLQQTPWLRNTGSFANSSEHRKYVDTVLKEELGPMFVGLPDFYTAYFDSVQNLEAASKTFFDECLGGSNPLFANGWRDWPVAAKQDDVLSWLAGFSEKLATFAESYDSAPACTRRPLAQPDKPIAGSIGKRKLDIGFVDDPCAGKDSRCDWTQILVPGELKSNLSADIPSDAWLDLGRYVREVFAAQPRRFVLGFTLCGSLLRVWAFDRLGGIASAQFDINKDGLRFVSTILGFLWMTEEELGFDPTIMMSEGRRFIEVTRGRGGSTERLILGRVMKRTRCIAGRATTCWKAYREEDPDTPLVVKDSWQYVERDDEGEWLREAAAKGAVRVAQYYYHQTVQVRNADDNVRDNVRKGLDITTATNYRQNRSHLSPSTGTANLRAGRSRSTAGTKRSSDQTTKRSSDQTTKRSSDQTSAPLPPSKRPCSISPVKAVSDCDSLPNRVHRRVILSDYGIPIYEASCLEVLLVALADCIEGHKSLRRKASLLHRDISLNNLMINKDNRGFLIDLDLAIDEQRASASGAKGKTGTWAFMAIGALQGEQHSFMHDLESFFWVLFWISIHFHGPREDRVVPRFDKWNYVDTDERAEDLAGLKLIVVSKEESFMRTTARYFTQYYQPLAPLMNGLRKIVFPGDKPWKREDETLYARMEEILRSK
ncbi:hypothetical protein BT67DRAFT_382143 [Trichocladium antarcticum]|uniref:non-specific serine/threonine protein kinase n=1 Tax=Trichocladium antarcticum TaxID=1450529 RepID=A0AAN6UIH4_9PEZI|nr:hypothetical protein BT67DRAFT_382143 [Trichocladium antarcticum]